MRREVIAAIVVGVAALGMGLFSITQERNRERYTDSLIVDPREDLVGEEPSAGSGTVARDRWRGSSPPPSSRSGSSTASRPRPRTGYGMVTAPRCGCRPPSPRRRPRWATRGAAWSPTASTPTGGW